MVLILVRKEWLAEIGELATDLLIREHSDLLSLAYAAKTEMDYPFVYTELGRNSKSKEGKAFVPVHIPVDAIRGMFDMTEAEEKKLGF
jgi:hypothetical protein